MAPKDVAALRAAVRADPTLVLDDPEVMQALIASTDGDGRNVVDLRGALVSRLESRLATLQRTHRSVIAAAYENLAGAGQVHRVALSLMDQPDAEAFLRALLVDGPEVLALDAARLAVEPGAALAAGAMATRVVALGAGGVEAYLQLGDSPGRDGVWLRPVPAEAELLWGEDAARIRSEALCAFYLGEGRAAVAFGAEDPKRFAPDDGADLVAFLGGVVARLARRWRGA